MNYFSLLSYSTATLSKIDPDSATAVGLKTALTEKLTVSESVLGSQSFAVFFRYPGTDHFDHGWVSSKILLMVVSLIHNTLIHSDVSFSSF